MPSFTIHIAIAKSYVKKHKSEIKDEEQFIKGNIAPDLEVDMKQLVKDKSKTHYGKWDDYSNIISINLFLKDKQVDIQKDYWKGYLLHLIVDHYFANVVFKEEALQIRRYDDTFYHDYNCLNKVLMEKYQIQPVENLEKYMQPMTEEAKYLKIDKVIEFIEKMSSINLENAIMIKKKEEEEIDR